MTSGSFRILWLLTIPLLLASGEFSTRTQENVQQPDVEIEGLSHEYRSCALVQFSVRNTSQQEVYVEVYAEKFESGSWDDEDYPYDIKDPKSRYIKRIITNPDMLKPEASLTLTYDRCLKPSFVGETKSAFINAIKKKDKEGASPVLQRVRVDVYILDQGHVKRVQQILSKTFKRVPENQPDPSAKHGNSSTPD
jgi:hypothetical protein